MNPRFLPDGKECEMGKPKNVRCPACDGLGVPPEVVARAKSEPFELNGSLMESDCDLCMGTGWVPRAVAAAYWRRKRRGETPAQEASVVAGPVIFKVAVPTS